MLVIPSYKKSDTLDSDQTDLIGFTGFIEQVIDSNEYDDAKEKGILLKVQSEGTERLSSKQFYVLDKIVERYRGQECKICGNSPDFEEAFNFDGLQEGYCNAHWHLMQKDEL